MNFSFLVTLIANSPVTVLQSTLALALMIALPTLLPFTAPFESTVATEVSELVQVIVGCVSTFETFAVS